MTKALEAASGVLKRGTLISQADCDRLVRDVILAFLDAAAMDKETAVAVGLAANAKYGISLTGMGHAATLALKEAANG